MKCFFKNEGIKVALVTIVINFVLFVFKLTAGIIGNSKAMVSDAIHSLSDVITTIIIIFGFIISSKDADDRHPYGHERLECVFAIVLSFFLFLTGLFIGYTGIKNIVLSSDVPIKIPSILPLIAAISSILVKEFMYHYTKRVAKKIKSSSLEADAWHHRTDAMSSVGSFIGILGAKLGFPILDPICSIIICLIIIKSAIDIFLQATSQMLDTSASDELKNEIVDLINDKKEVIEIKDMKTRIFGSRIYIDLDLVIDGDKSLKVANNIVKNIHDEIEEKYSSIKHCNIHILPDNI